jgi:hypothetical protein
MSVKRLVPLHAVVLDTDPAIARIGDIYYNSIDDKLKYFDGTSWNPVGGAITGLLEHVHTYDGHVFSVEANEVPNSGIIDGGSPA